MSDTMLEPADLATLQAIPFVAGLDEGRRLQTLAAARRLDFRPGDPLFREPEPSPGLMMLGRGKVRLLRTANGRVLSLGEVGAPVSIMTIGLFDGGSNGMSAVAASECVVYAIRTEEFERICLSQARICRGLLREFAARQRELTSLIGMISGSSVRERVARVLGGMAGEAGNDVVLPCSQGPFAICLGTVREVLSRTLKHMHDEGLIEVDGIRISIRDRDALRQAAGAAVDAAAVDAPRAMTPCFTDKALTREKSC